MKIKIVLDSNITLDAEVKSIEDFCESIRGIEWLRAGDGGVIRTSAIKAVIPQKETIAEVNNGN